MNKKKKSTNTSPYPDEAIERLARAFYPAILACWNSEEGQREFRQNRLILQEKKNRKFPLGNFLLYISLLSVAFGRVRPGGRTLFLLYHIMQLDSIKDEMINFSSYNIDHKRLLQTQSPHLVF